MQISLKNYTLRYLIPGILLVMAIWASLFYAYILDEVYDNVDDGLKNQKIEIIREAYGNPELLETKAFGVNQFRIVQVDEKDYSPVNVFRNEFIYMPYDEEDEPYRILKTGFYAKDGKTYSLEIRTSTVEEDDLMLDLATALLVLYIVIVLSIFLINQFVLTKAYRPFRKILQNLQAYRFGGVNNLAKVESNVIEFNQLNTEINQMIQRNEDVFAEQKRFIENASHELQTPLAITINRLDLLMEDEDLPEKHLVQLAETKDAIHRMVNLNKSLLMLSRIENRQFQDVEQISFNDSTREVINDYEDLIAFKQLDLRLECKADFYVSMNPNLAQVLISNLLRNAIKYNHAEGVIAIEITQGEWKIRNSSTGLPLNEKFIFQRFHKQSQDALSNGLGLAIVKSIVDSYPGLSIVYSFENNFHVFSLNFKNS
ncbi:sensor histidine kinase [Sphingobacterium hungaricum]|uniref:histidine kinase n=1 Tax=Sphingobacterium hungaricum TaxID=2082723 RepID=A0A928UX05_9SPHI|nr:HAMP domain-containing sensor histidine kinase [Sphingobacterium hungaricum]MBE8714548.1 sensor histidine kinase [Sphingobacterium hungaricum]